MLYPIDSDGVLVKLETVYGTDPTPSPSSDFVRVAQRMWSNIEVAHEWENLREETATGSNQPAPPALPKGRVITFNLYVEMRGSGTEDTPPEWDALHQACGNDQVVNTGVDVQYPWISDVNSHESVTIYAYSGNKLFKGHGCVGDVEWIVTGGEVTILHYTIQGIMVDNPTEVSVPTIDYGAILPPPAVDVTALIGGTIATDFTQITIAQGNEVVRVTSPNVSVGIDGLRIAVPRCRPVVTINAKAEAISTYSPWADERARTERALQVRVGTAGGERLTFDVDVAHVQAPGNEDQDGFTGNVLTFRCMDHLWTHD